MNAQLAPRDSTMSLGDWLITLIVLCIPIVGLIMAFVWGFSSGTNINKQNFCRATLILWLILIALYIVLFAVFGAALFSAAHSMSGATM
ncbi:MAG TPA: hypothetical protein VFJ87_00610 [Rhodanobacteraceae bacterium]|nr:hypothetical protein [Rhodanobacteraceae bacterium]